MAWSPPGGCRRNRARVYENRAALQRAEHPVRPFHDELDVGRVRQHRNDARGTSRDVGRRRCPNGTGRDEFVHGALAAAVGDDREARLQQIFGHGTSHDTESDESNGVRHRSKVYVRC